MALVREKVSFILLRGFLPGVEQRGIRGKVGKKGRATVSPYRGNRDKEVVKKGWRGIFWGASIARNARIIPSETAKTKSWPGVRRN